MAKRFYEQESYDFTIMDGNETVGHLRVKPSAVLWKPKGYRKYYRVKIDELEAHAKALGNEVNK